MAESIGDLHIALRASADKIASDINAGLNAAQGQVQARAVALGTVIAAGITAGMATIAASIKSAVGLGFEGLANIDNLDEAASKIGMTYNGLKTLQFAAESTGSSLESMVSAIAKMEGGIASGAAGDALKSLRLDADALRQLSPENQFAEISQKLSEIGNTGDKIDLTKQIFGRGGVDILNVINEGKAGLEGWSKTVGELQGKLSPVQVAIVGMANDNMDKLKAGWSNVKDQIGAGIAPALTLITQKLLDITKDTKAIGPMVEGWVNNTVNFAASLVTAAQIADAIGSAFVSIGTAIKTAVTSAYALGQTMKAAFTVITNDGKFAFKMMAASIADSIVTAMNALKNTVLKTLNDIATQGALVGLKIAKALDFTGAGSQVFDSTENILKTSAANYKPQSVVPDLPTGAADGGPQSALFPGGQQEITDGLNNILVDYTQLETVVTTANDQITNSGLELAKQLGTTKEKLDQITAGNYAGDKIRTQFAAARAEMEKQAQERLASATNTGNALNNINKTTADNTAKITGNLAKNQVTTTENADKQIGQIHERTANAFQTMNQGVVTDMVTSWATGTGKISDIISQWAGNMLKQFVQLSLFGNGSTMGGLAGMLIGSGGGASMVGSVISGLFGAAHANGGRPAMGKIALIGEKGPELWAPDSAGTIIPNNRIASFAPSQPQQQGGGPPAMESPIIINQSFATGVTHADLAGAMDSVLDQTRNAVAEGVSRGGGFRRSIQR